MDPFRVLYWKGKAMSESKSGPLLVAPPARPICPVCGKASYSVGGTHPQCAVTRADTVMKVARKAKAAVAGSKPAQQKWSKRCPRCGRQSPARRFVCDCGHKFAGMPEPAVKRKAK